jgi:hypothetical protein
MRGTLLRYCPTPRWRVESNEEKTMLSRRSLFFGASAAATVAALPAKATPNIASQPSDGLCLFPGGITVIDGYFNDGGAIGMVPGDVVVINRKEAVVAWGTK